MVTANDRDATGTPAALDTDANGGQWVPDFDDGSGWAEVDWVSAARGSRYYYRHAEPREVAERALPEWYRVVTRLETENLHTPHENSYFVPRASLNDFLGELILAGGDETIWHVEGCDSPPAESLANGAPRG